MSRRYLASLLAAAAASLLVACGPPFMVCNEIAEVAVAVRVVDSSGAMVMDAVVTYTLDQGPEEQAECFLPLGSSTSQCKEWAAGYEQPGTYTVTATSADGTRRATQTVSVKGGACEVYTQQVQLMLPD
jgi:hypothetical protein